MDENVLGKRIKQLRIEAGLTQEKFGKPYSIKKSTVSQYESGSSRPNDELKKRIASDYNVSLDWLMGLSENRTPAESMTDIAQNEIELMEFCKELKERKNLHQLYRQLQALSDSGIKQVSRFVRVISEEEENE